MFKNLYLQGYFSFSLRIFYYIQGVSQWTKRQNDAFSFVPTMGALHAGHLALVENAKALDKPVLVSIFVNPAQFNNAEDLQKYPRTLTQDLLVLSQAGVDAVYLPVTEDLYPEGLAEVNLDLGVLDRVFEGQKRPGHFKGVVKVLHRLFSVLNPEDVFFGQKDLQQCLVVEKLIDKHFPRIHQHNIPTQRDPQTGLALSSRNTRLTENGLRAAANISLALKQVVEADVLKQGLDVMPTACSVEFFHTASLIA
ncbi:MAG: 4-phosphopantoate--beta-alanine ligase, partial [Bacteroidetes bacterium]|nr:4-phosphopantoate--beta-alanine ligase [Bacteroidota bacterium]